MNYGLFLDDERIPSDVTWISLPKTYWFVCHDFDWFKFSVTEGGMPKFVSFDHDLQDFDKNTGEEYTGMTCLKWLVEYCMDNNLNIPICFFHTQNPIGKINMETYYNNAVKHYHKG